MTELIDTLQKELTGKNINEQFQYLVNMFPGKIVFSTSLGQEDQVITDIVAKNHHNVKIFTIDTGRLFSETYQLIDRTRERYKIGIDVYFPESNDVEELVSKKGFFSFFESVDNRIKCCHIRKVKPLARALKGMKVWVTGLRAEQSANRKDMPLIEWVEDKQLFKFNPLINWSYDDVIEHIEKFNVPDNPLHHQGFFSIGCSPCTRAIEAGEDSRAGRWWWETSQKECGLHK